jgi:small-conductance mechanosensitive channel
LHESLLRALPGMFRGVLVFLVFWMVAGAGRRVIALAAPRVRADTGVVLLLSRIYYYGILIFGTITALGAAGMNVSALVAGLGLTGFALGFALKDVLSNLLSGIMLLLYRPFNIGDQIRMGEYEGTIETIRMRDTLVRAHDGRLIVIPNTKLITEVVVNNTYARQQQGTEATGERNNAAPVLRPATAATAPPPVPPAESEEYWPPQQ